MKQTEERVSIRYGVTLAFQMMQLVLSAFTVGLVPRALGPADYGNYTFVYNMASSLRSFFDLGGHSTFFTYSSKVLHSGALTKVYGFWLSLQLALSLSLILAARQFNVLAWIWPRQHLHQIVVITVLEWLIAVTLMMQQLGDSKGRTIWTQTLGGLISLIGAAGILLLAFLKHLNLFFYVAWLYLTTFVTLISLAYYLFIMNKPVCWEGNVSEHFHTYLRYWRSYASPLVLFGIYCSLVNCLDGYLIQRLYGAPEQAYLALAVRFSSFVLIFTTSALSIYWREIAGSLATQNKTEVIRINLRFSRILFGLTLSLSLWLACNASAIVRILAGDAYRAAAPVLIIMAFNPLQQTLGQLSGVFFMASERTALYRDLGVWISIPALFLTYFFLAPSTAPLPGLGLGAMGIALKTVGYGLLSIQAYDIANARFLGISYLSTLFEKARVASVLGGTALASFGGIGVLLHSSIGAMNPLAILIIKTMFYFGLIGLVFVYQPTLIGFMPDDLERGKQFLLKKLLGKNGKADPVLTK